MDLRGPARLLQRWSQWCFWRGTLTSRCWNLWIFARPLLRWVTRSGGLDAYCRETAITVDPHRGHGRGGWLFLTAWFPRPKHVCNGAGRPIAAYTRLPFTSSWEV